MAKQLTKQELDSLKPFLCTEVEHRTTKSKGGLYVCPICKSGAKENKTGALSIDPKDPTFWKCFACERKGDIFDFVAACDNISSSEATKYVIDKYLPDSTVQSIKPAATLATTPVQKQENNANTPEEESEFLYHRIINMGKGQYYTDIMRYADALDGSPGYTYLQGRGFSFDTMKRYKLGYDADSNAITIPFDANCGYYARRSIDPNAPIRHKFLKGESKPLYNVGALYKKSGNEKNVCFIVESPLCAISILQCDARAVALAGCEGGLLLETLAEKPTDAIIILALDNDEAGRAATDKIGNALEKAGVYVIDGTGLLMGECTDITDKSYRKDPNEVLQKDGAELLKVVVSTAIDDAVKSQAAKQKAEMEKQKAEAGALIVDDFLNEIQTERYTPMPTGEPLIDNAIGGGLIRQQLVLLGAPPATGKTAFATWLFESMVQKSDCVDVLCFNLEMSRSQLMARSLSRIIKCEYNGRAMQTNYILQGNKWRNDTETKALITDAAEFYKRKIAPHFVYEHSTGSDLDKILAHCRTEAKKAVECGMNAPLIVIDYLQLIGGREREDDVAIIKRAVAAFKDYAINFNTIVFMIVAHNRASNKTGITTMESGRDTSALEYSADLYLGLDFTDCITSNKTVSELNSEQRTFLTMKVIKSRFGRSNEMVHLKFDGETMSYKVLEKGNERDIQQHNTRNVAEQQKRDEKRNAFVNAVELANYGKPPTIKQVAVILGQTEQTIYNKITKYGYMLDKQKGIIIKS